MKHVLVIGASRGIGLELVRQYRDFGDRVVATARDDDGLRGIQALGAKPLRLDVTDPASLAAFVTQLEGEKVDLAFYVAGVYSTEGATEPPTRDQFDRLMHTNVLGAMQLIPEVAPLVEAAAGKFVFLSSQMAYMGGTDSSFGWTYRVSKAALNMVVKSAQQDYRGAVMVAISPGWVQTDMGGPGAPMTVEQSVTWMRRTLDGLTARHKGAFLNYDGRRFKGW